MHVEVCSNPVFIIGSPRSGTTALAWAMAEHPDFWTSNESQILFDLFGGGALDKNYQREGKTSWLRHQGIEPAEFLDLIGIGVNAVMTRAAGGLRWIDHTPVYTLMAESIAGMFPGARFIHILRDGRRVTHSMINYAAQFGPNAPGAPWAASFREACRTWVEFTDTAMGFQEAHPDRVVTIRNEDLVGDAPAGFRQIFEFLGVENHPGSAEFFARRRINSSFGPPGKNVGAADTLTDPWSQWGVSRKQAFVQEASETMIRHGLARPEDFALTAWEHGVLSARRALQECIPSDARVFMAGAAEAPEIVDGNSAWETTPLEAGLAGMPEPRDFARAAAEGAEFAAILGPVLRAAGGVDRVRRSLAGHQDVHISDDVLIIRLTREPRRRILRGG
jgi:hypothetical protein